MSQKLDVIANESVASIRDIQKNPSKALKGITRVIRGSKTVGFFFSNKELDELLEDLEMIGSKNLRLRVREARREFNEGKTVSLDVLAKKYGI